MRVRHAGDLNLPDERHQAPQARGHVAVQDLAVKDVELELQVRWPERSRQVGGLVDVAQEVAGHAARVDRLDQQIEAVLGQTLCALSERPAVGRAGERIAGIG